MRIFDNPGHPQYGPVRRMWIILAQLDLLTDAEQWQASRSVGGGWDEALAAHIVKGWDEARAQRFLLRVILEEA